MFFEGVAGVRPGGICGAGQHIGLAADLDDVGGVAAASSLSVEGVDGAASDRSDCVFHKTGAIASQLGSGSKF